MSECGCGHGATADVTRQTQVLIAVLLINAVMFVVEAGAGIVAHSSALLADSLDMLGDALVYGFSLYVVARSMRWKAASALIKGVIQLAFGVTVLALALHQLVAPALPSATAITAVGALALAANAVCAVLLLRHRHDDLNMHSVWLCSRNDLIGNLAVIGAGALVALTHSQWPDLVVGFAIALLFLRTSFSVIGGSLAELRQPA
jgi:cation diffusion facilitator family transporter